MDDHGAFVLNGVGTGLVEGLDARVVVGNEGIIERFEGDLAEDGEGFFEAVGAGDGDASADGVGAVAELAQHFGGVAEVVGFAEGDVVEIDESVGGDDEGSGLLMGDDGGLEAGVFEGEGFAAKGGVVAFFDFGDADFKLIAGFAEEFDATGRGGGKDEALGGH